jgi:hypothetical protein
MIEGFMTSGRRARPVAGRPRPGAPAPSSEPSENER